MLLRTKCGHGSLRCGRILSRTLLRHLPGPRKRQLFPSIPFFIQICLLVPVRPFFFRQRLPQFGRSLRRTRHGRMVPEFLFYVGSFRHEEEYVTALEALGGGRVLAHDGCVGRFRFPCGRDWWKHWIHEWWRDNWWCCYSVHWF